MKKIVLIFYFLSFFNLLHSQKLSQQVIGAIGGNGQSNKVSLSWTLGEAVISSFEPKLTQGFHQGDLTIDINTDCDFVNPKFNFANNLNIRTFPNPTSGLISLSLDNIESVVDYSYKLYDNVGRMITMQKTTDRVSQIDFSNMAGGAYLLVVYFLNVPVKEFKIIKQN